MRFRIISHRHYLYKHDVRTRKHMRALLTDREKEVLSGKADDINHPSQYRNNTRKRLEKRLERLEDDLTVLEEHEPQLAQEIRDEICNGTMSTELRDVLGDIQKDVREHRQRVEGDN